MKKSWFVVAVMFFCVFYSSVAVYAGQIRPELCVKEFYTQQDMQSVLHTWKTDPYVKNNVIEEASHAYEFVLARGPWHPGIAEPDGGVLFLRTPLEKGENVCAARVRLYNQARAIYPKEHLKNNQYLWWVDYFDKTVSYQIMKF